MLMNRFTGFFMGKTVLLLFFLVLLTAWFVVHDVSDATAYGGDPVVSDAVVTGGDEVPVPAHTGAVMVSEDVKGGSVYKACPSCHEVDKDIGSSTASAL